MGQAQAQSWPTLTTTFWWLRSFILHRWRWTYVGQLFRRSHKRDQLAQYFSQNFCRRFFFIINRLMQVEVGVCERTVTLSHTNTHLPTVSFDLQFKLSWVNAAVAVNLSIGNAIAIARLCHSSCAIRGMLEVSKCEGMSWQSWLISRFRAERRRRKRRLIALACEPDKVGQSIGQAVSYG